MRRPAQLAQASKLAHDIDERARHGEDFGKLAVTYSQAETALKGGHARLAQRHRAADLPRRRGLAAEPGRGQRRHADLQRLSPGQAQRQAHVAAGAADRAAVSSAPHPDQADGARGRRHRAAEAHADARPRSWPARRTSRCSRRTNSQDPGSAVNGGDLGWSELSNFVPEFSTVAASLKERRDQRALPHPVRLAHRADARPSRLQQLQRSRARAGV